MTDAAEEVRQGQEEPESERERSTIGFPYLDLDDAVEVAKAVHEVGGSSCEWEQLAAKLGMAAKGGGFRMRVLAAKIFGFLSYDKSTVTLSESGLRAADSQQEKSARVDGFLNVPLYKRVYDQFKGTSLPGTSGIETFMVSVGVAQKVKDKARQVFQRSAKQAGFFELSADRLTMPSIRGGAKQSASSETDAGRNESDKSRQKDSGSGTGGGNYHPFIEGLLKTLPAAETAWEIDKRAKWLQAAANIFELIYTASDDSKSLTIKAE